MPQRWMRLSKSRKLWISTRSNYFQIEILTFYVTENMPATTAWQPTHRLERALGRPDRARRSVGERHRARTDCGSAEGRTRAICCGDPAGKAELALRADQRADNLQQHDQVHGIAGRRDEIEAFVECSFLIILGVYREGPKAGNFRHRKRPGVQFLQITAPNP